MKRSMSVEFTTIPPSPNMQTGPRILTVAYPGLMGNVGHQITPVAPTLQSFGETLLIQPTGTRYDAQRFAEMGAEVTARRLATGAFDMVAHLGISMGGRVGNEALHHLHSNN